MQLREAKAYRYHYVPQLFLGKIRLLSPLFKSRLYLTPKKNHSDCGKQELKTRCSHFVNCLQFMSQSELYLDQKVSQAAPFAAGDAVLVRSEEQIRATLNAQNEFKGCMFMEAQRQYCGTIQHVLNPVERFVDERDCRVRKASGVVLLKGLICEGTPEFGRCDRACFYFWREEWLEKLNEKEVGKISG